MKKTILKLAIAAALPAVTLTVSAQEKVVVSAAFKSVFYLPAYVALERGYFKDEGLDVRIDVASSSTNALAAVIAQSADFSLHGPEWTAISAGRGAPVKVIGGTLNRLGVWLTCEKGVKYESFKSLSGLTVATGTMPTTSTSVFFKLLKRAGLEPKKDVNIIEVPLGNEIGPLVAGKVDCAVLYEPNGSLAESKGYKVVAAFSQQIGPYTFSAISTRTSVNPATARKFLSSIDRALKDIHANPAAAVQSGQKLFPDLDPKVVDASVRRLITDGVYAKSVEVDSQALKDALQTQIDLGNLASVPDEKVYLDLAAANEIAAKKRK